MSNKWYLQKCFFVTDLPKFYAKLRGVLRMKEHGPYLRHTHLNSESLPNSSCDEESCVSEYKPSDLDADPSMSICLC